MLSILSVFPKSLKFWALSYLLALTLILVTGASAYSAHVTLAWDPNTEPDLAGYKVYYSNSSRDYEFSVDVGNETTYTLWGLEADKTYYFAATAYDDYGNESDYSEEVAHFVEFVDSDGDGVSDDDEQDIYGTDLNNPDTDGDGMDDGDELNFWQDDWEADDDGDGLVNLLDPDSDGDGFSDGEEYTNGTDPSNPYSVPSSVTVYEDAEDGNVDGWDVYDDTQPMQITNVFDQERQSRVIELIGSGWESGARLRNADFSKWHNEHQFVLQWNMKYSESFCVYIDVETTAGQRFMYYTPVDHDGLGSNRYVHHGLGTDVIDGQWHTFVRDLQADLEEAQPQATILEVNGFWIRGSGRLDDIKLHNDAPSDTIVYEDAEDGSVDGWDVYDDTQPMQITNVFDQERQSRVIELIGSGWESGARLRNADFSKWHNEHQFVLQWNMKYSECFCVYIDVETTAGQRFMYYTPVDHDGLGSNRYVHHGLGTDVIDGQWHTFVRDLQADLEEAQPQATILEVNGFWIRGSGRLDDIELHDDVPSDTIVYEDAEDGSVDGWDVYDDTQPMQITNVFDQERQNRVIELIGSGWESGARLRNADFSKWHNSHQFVVQWNMKYSEYFWVYIDVETTAGQRFMYYTPADYDGLGGGGYAHHGLGTDVIDGQWHTFVRDLQADLEEAQPQATILEVNGFWIRGSGKLDNIKLNDEVPLQW